MQARRGNAQALTFELGGKSPNIVFADADLDAAVDGALSASTSTRASAARPAAACSCEDKVYDEFVDRLVERRQASRSSAPASTRTTEQGPQVDRSSSTRCSATSTSASDERRTSPSPAASAYGDDGLLRRADGLRRREGRHGDRPDEIFGPVIVAVPVQGRVDEVVARGQRHHLRPGRRRLDPRHRQGPPPRRTQLKAGTVWVNCYDVFDAAAPFGGFKKSGIGRELGENALDNYTELKTVFVEPGRLRSSSPAARANVKPRSPRVVSAWSTAVTVCGALAAAVLQPVDHAAAGVGDERRGGSAPRRASSQSWVSTFQSAMRRSSARVTRRSCGAEVTPNGGRTQLTARPLTERSDDRPVVELGLERRERGRRRGSGSPSS